MPSPSSGQIVIFTIAVTLLACFILFRMFIYLRSIKKRQGSNTASTDGGKGFPRANPDKKELRQVISQYGFNAEQAEFFTRLCTANLVGSPVYLVENSEAFNTLVNDTFRRLQLIHAPTNEQEKSKTILFTIHETVENRRKLSQTISSTRSLQNGQPFTLITRKNEHYPSIVLYNSAAGLHCKVPHTVFGDELRLPARSRVRIIFYTSGGQTYEFPGRILKYETVNNETRMILAHTAYITAFPNRLHDRKSFRTPCLFSHVTMKNMVTGRNAEHKFVVSTKAFAGTIRDISSGGCSIETAAVPPVGDYVSIKFILEKKIEDTAIGKIISINRTDKHREAVMHIQFAKMPRASLNRIFSFIYNYGAQTK